MYVRFGKRWLDIAVASLALVALAPLLAILFVVVRGCLGAPVIFRQFRPGKQGTPFEMLKFRTMTDVRDEKGEPLPDADRLPRFGRLLRSSSLDELPELWNVVRGDMSLVGPRPLLIEYLPLYSVEQARRHEVRPGITGLAQVRGRNALSWEEKFESDLEYVENLSLALDLRIAWRTLAAVFFVRGVSAQGNTTMPRFTGSLKEEPPHARAA